MLRLPASTGVLTADIPDSLTTGVPSARVAPGIAEKNKGYTKSIALRFKELLGISNYFIAKPSSAIKYRITFFF
jgi:hypothetical protein